MAERKMADALDQLYKDGVKMEVQKAKGELSTELDSKLDTKAPINSPALTGTPTAPTPAANDNSTKIATTAYVLKLLKNNPGIIDEILNSLANKIDKTTADNTYAAKSSVPTLASSTGTSMTQGMTQKAITDALNGKVSTTILREAPSSSGTPDIPDGMLYFDGSNKTVIMTSGNYMTIRSNSKSFIFKDDGLYLGNTKITN